MHIMVVSIGEISVSYDIENVSITSKHGAKGERVMPIATFKKNGDVIHKIYNIGNFDYCAKLLDRAFAKQEAQRMIDSCTRSAHSPFKAVCNN